MSEEIQNNEEQSGGLDIDMSLCCPGPDARPEPYHAVMKIGEDGNTDGQLWGMGSQLMLFDDLSCAKQIIDALGDASWQIRGVTKAHLGELKKLQEAGVAQLFVIVGFVNGGRIEAMPLDEHQARMKKAGTPPPIKR
ncbi:MAG: hypothetical protein IKY83_04445 [Proteobacteria bacterium]|nr:hypothetical protein [Pseudomonadota bacterium]